MREVRSFREAEKGQAPVIMMIGIYTYHRDDRRLVPSRFSRYIYLENVDAPR